MVDTKKILVVEDDTETRKLYQEELEDTGYSVITAVNGEEGLQKIQEGGYNLILLDIMMPKLDGIAILSKLQLNQPGKKNGPIIVVTNMANDPILNKAISLGASAYFIKSDLTPDQLIERVQTYIN